MNTKVAAIVLALFRELKVHRFGSTTLVVRNGGTNCRARSGVAADRAIGHVVDDVHVGVLGRGDVETGEREPAILRTGRERGG